MTASNPKNPSINAVAPGRNGLRRLVSALAILCGLLVFPIALGIVLPGIPQLGAIATLCESFFSLHLLLLALIGLTLALDARRLGGRRAVAVAGVTCALGVIVTIVPLVALIGAARESGAPISWRAHLHVTAIGAKAVPTETVQYASLDGRSLYLDVYRPDRARFPNVSSPVFMVHGGGFTMGNRSDARNWDRWLSEQGYTVFDVDYRLAPPVSWNLAAQDLACAMAWVAARADAYHVAADRAVIEGHSAGGSLALQAAYGLGDGSVVSSCGGSPVPPVAVIAFYPAEDMTLAWAADTKVGPLHIRDASASYLGGSPQQFPERYRATSAFNHIRAGLPPTFIAYGDRDHVIPLGGHPQLASKLAEVGVPHVVVSIPYVDHAYDAFWGGLGTQITRHALGDFLRRYVRVAAAPSAAATPTG